MSAQCYLLSDLERRRVHDGAECSKSGPLLVVFDLTFDQVNNAMYNTGWVLGGQHGITPYRIIDYIYCLVLISILGQYLSVCLSVIPLKILSGVWLNNFPNILDTVLVLLSALNTCQCLSKHFSVRGVFIFNGCAA